MQIERKYGAIKDSLDLRDHLVAAPVPGSLFQVETDLSSFFPAIRDQGNEGSCTGHAGRNLLSTIWNQFHGVSLDFSPQFLYRAERICEGDPNVDGGAQSRTMVALLTETGICLEADDPYVDTGWKNPTTLAMLASAEKYRAGAYHRVWSLDTLRSTIASKYPASLAIAVYESFESDAVAKTGLVPMPSGREALMGYHEVCVAGISDTKRLIKVANSWGQEWGDQGYFYLPFDYWDLVQDSWTAHLGKVWRPKP